jgi:acetyl/propionyl-CoA carboxylase alpha subunit
MPLIEIKELIETILQHEVEEIEIESDGVKVRIRKTAAIPPPKTVENDAHFVVRAPIAGTFHRANGDKKPLVSEGETVELGRVLCVIDSRGQVNEIESEVAGQVATIHVKPDKSKSLTPQNPSQTAFVTRWNKPQMWRRLNRRKA